MVSREAILARLAKYREDEARITRAYLQITGAIKALQGILDDEEGQEDEPEEESGISD